MPSQASLYDQLLQVRALANKSGYYDAADFLTKHIEAMDTASERGGATYHGTKPGMYYIRFDDETLQEAIDSHSIGFKSVEDAIGEAEALHPGQGLHFVVYDWSINVVANTHTSKVG